MLGRLIDAFLSLEHELIPGTSPYAFITKEVKIKKIKKRYLESMVREYL